MKARLRTAGLAAFLAALLAPGALIAGPGVTIGEKVASSGTGNADLYGGGEPRLERMALASQRLGATLAFVASRGEISACSAARCEGSRSPALCAIVQSLTPAESAACDRFVRESAPQLGAIAAALSPASFALSPSPLTLSDATGKARAVAAMTSTSGRILVHAPAIDGMTEDELFALVAHEIGHKLPHAKAPRDDAPYGPFTRGSRLLDAAGAALAWLSLEAGAPSQEPRPLEGEPRQSFCSASDPVAAGRLADLTGAAFAESDLAAATAALAAIQLPRARGHWLLSTFRAYYRRDPSPEETRHFLSRFEAGRSADEILATLVGASEYMALDARASAFVHRFFIDFVGRDPRPEELRVAEGALGRFDRASWALAMLRRSPDTRAAAVRGWFHRYLNRLPSAPELESDVARLGAGETWESVQARLLASGEYAGLQRKRALRCETRTASAATAIRAAR